MPIKQYSPPHPGEILKTTYLDPLGLKCHVAAQHIGISTKSLAKIIRGEQRITVRMAFKFQKAFSRPARFWLTVQNDWDIWIEHIEKKYVDENEFEPLFLSQATQQIDDKAKIYVLQNMVKILTQMQVESEVEHDLPDELYKATQQSDMYKMLQCIDWVY